jgi:hypothetical protein
LATVSKVAASLLSLAGAIAMPECTVLSSSRMGKMPRKLLREQHKALSAP